MKVYSKPCSLDLLPNPPLDSISTTPIAAILFPSSVRTDRAGFLASIFNFGVG